jgi:hypothetical protein
MELEGSLPCSQKLAVGPYPELAEFNSTYRKSCQRISPGPRRFETFRNLLLFYGEVLLAPRPKPKLEDQPLSAVCDCLFNVFAPTLWRPSPPSTTWGRAKPWWHGTHLPWQTDWLIYWQINVITPEPVCLMHFFQRLHSNWPASLHLYFAFGFNDNT